MGGMRFFFFLFLSYLTALSVWNTDEEIERRPATGHDKHIRDLNTKSSALSFTIKWLR